jgi:hypothetical protein
VKVKEPLITTEAANILGKRDKPEIEQIVKHHDEVSR